MANKSKNNKFRLDLSSLPQSIHKQSRYWYMDTKTGARVHVSQLYKYLPQSPTQHEAIMEKRWDLRE